MKFIIERTSDFRGGKQPCEGATQEKVIMTNKCKQKSIQEFDKNRTNEMKWGAFGFNHREDGQFIYRDFEETEWFINIDNLKDLLELAEKYGGEIIINTKTKTPPVEIYDTYRE